MRILQVIPYFAPAWAYGGPPRLTYELSRELVRRGHSVTVLTSDTLDASRRIKPLTEELDGIDVHRLPNLSNILAWKGQMFLPVGTVPFLRARLKEFDVVHVHMFRTSQNIAVQHYAPRIGVPYVVSAHGSLPHIVRWRVAKALYDGAIGSRLLRDAGRVLALSEAEKEQYEAAGVPPSKISIVYNGIDPDLFRTLPPRGEFAREHGLDGKKLITYVGRLNVRKGLDHLLRAFRDLSDTRPDTALVLVGTDDGYGTTLQRMAEEMAIADRVTFTGLIDHLEKLRVYVDSDVVVYPSAYEIFGLVPFEAVLCGKPVVVADDSGCGEIIGRARAGLTVPYGDATRLREAIASSLGDDPQIPGMVLRGRRFVLEELSWSRIAQNMERVYESVIEPATQAITIGS